MRELLLAGFYTDHKYGPFSGSNVAAQIDTQEFQPVPGRRARVMAARPLVDGGSPTLAVGTRRTQQDSVTWTTARSMTNDGRVPLRAEGRYLRFRTAMPAASTYTWLQGVDIEDGDIVPGGKR